MRLTRITERIMLIDCGIVGLRFKAVEDGHRRHGEISIVIGDPETAVIAPVLAAIVLHEISARSGRHGAGGGCEVGCRIIIVPTDDQNTVIDLFSDIAIIGGLARIIK